MVKNSRWVVILPALWFALFASPVEAVPQPGLNAIGYTIDDIPPTQSDNSYPTCGSELENNINRNFNGEPFAECGWDWFMVHYTGFITIPENESIEFMVAADDGGTVDIGGYSMGTWNLKGCSWSAVISPPLSEGTYPLDGWFFEAGGGTCYMLAWKIDDGYWEIVPEWAYTTEYIPPTTTTTTTVPPETVPVTDPPTTTTVQETSTSTSELVTTTSSVPVTTTLLIEVTSTTEQVTTTSQSTTTSSSTTTMSTLPPSTSTTQEWVSPPQTTMPAPVVTEPPVSDTEAPPPQEPEEQSPDISLPEPIQLEPENPNLPVVTDVEPSPSFPPGAPESPVIDDTPETVANTPETLLEALDASNEPTPDEAKALATNPAVLAVASTEQATEIFQALELSELTETEVAELVAAVQNAPQEVRAVFEETIDIFKSGLDDYVPLGSTIPVAVRRTLIAAGAALTVASSSIRRK